MTRDRHDIRDEKTDLVQALVDTAFDDPSKREDIARFLFGDLPVGPPPGNWPPPTEDDRERANAQSRKAALAARDQLRASGMRYLETGLKEQPRTPIGWEPLQAEQAIPPAPLAYCLIAFDQWRVFVTLAVYAFARHTREVFDEEIRQQLLRRLNGLARLEARLWQFATEGESNTRRHTSSGTTSHAGSGTRPSTARSSACDAATSSTTSVANASAPTPTQRPRRAGRHAVARARADARMIGRRTGSSPTGAPHGCCVASIPIVRRHLWDDATRDAVSNIASIG